MKSRLIIGAKVATLLGTGWLLIATSPMPPECTPEGPLAYDVTGTCGPAAEVQLSRDNACNLTVAGAEAANLPENGDAFWVDRPINSGAFRLITFGPDLVVPGGAQADAGTGQDAGEDADAGVESDAGVDSDAGVESDAGVDEDGGTTLVADGGTSYLPGRAFSTCDVGSAGPDGALEFECYDAVTAEVVCTGTLTPKP